MVRIAVIGASGFIGLRTCEVFEERSDVTVLPVVRAYSSLAVLARRKYSEGWRVSSFVDPEELSQSLQGCDVCVHAAIGDARQIPLMAEVAYKACELAGVKRLVWLSSTSVHGQNPNDGTTELSPLHNRHALIYNNAKVRAEWALEKSQKDGHVEVVRLRPSIVFGPRSRWIFEIAQDFRRQTVGWIDDGEGVCNTIFVDNLVEAIRLASISKNAAGNAFLVGDDEAIRWRDFYLPIAKYMESSESNIQLVAPFEVSVEKESIRSKVTFSKPYQFVRPWVPGRIKKLGKVFLAGVSENAGRPAYRLIEKESATLTGEQMLLQKNRWLLSSQKAKAEIGYVPLYSFEQGMEESIKWLEYVQV